MPGIVGLITKRPRQWAIAQLRRMVSAIRHESFYTTGTWVDESLGLYVGWTAIQGAFDDCMPLHDERRRLTLVFSGEEYSERTGPGKKQESAGYLLRIAAQSVGFPRSLDGMFHGLLADAAAETITLFNDRYGMHRLCYHESNGVFYFGTEAKAILATRSDLRVPSPQGLAEYLACSCVLENRTIFKDIALMPAASCWVFRGCALRDKKSYFSPTEWEEQEPLNAQVYYEELHKSVSKTIPRYFDESGRTAVALTGGMDTRLIMAYLQPAAGTVPTYTFGGMLRDCRDVQVARKVAEVCRQTHRVIKVGDEYLKKFPYYAERTAYLSEGGVDAYRAADLYVSEVARQFAPVKVVGTYGSEIIRHAVMFKPMLRADGLLQGELISEVRRAHETYAAIRRTHPVTFAAFRQSPWFHQGVLALEQTQLTVRSPFMGNDFVAAAYRAPVGYVDKEDVRLRLIARTDPALSRIPSDRGVGGALGPVASALARAYFRFTFKAEYACDDGMPAWAAPINFCLSPLGFDQIFLGRHKYLHYRMWYRDALSKYVQEILLDGRTLSRSFLDRASVQRSVLGHVQGTRNTTIEIHKLLAMELLFRQFFDAQPNDKTEPTPSAGANTV